MADASFRGWIKRYSYSREVHSDQGRHFESVGFLEMCKLLEISKTRTTPLQETWNGRENEHNDTKHVIEIH